MSNDEKYGSLSAGAALSLIEEDEQVILDNERAAPHFEALSKKMQEEFRTNISSDVTGNTVPTVKVSPLLDNSL